MTVAVTQPNTKYDRHSTKDIIKALDSKDWPCRVLKLTASLPMHDVQQVLEVGIV
jgi:hypothetical protein